MGVVCNDRCLCSDIIIIYLPELFAFSASRFRQTIQAGILYYYTSQLSDSFDTHNLSGADLDLIYY